MAVEWLLKYEKFETNLKILLAFRPIIRIFVPERNQDNKLMATKHVQYETHGTCSKLIDVTVDENNIIQAKKLGEGTIENVIKAICGQSARGSQPQEK